MNAVFGALVAPLVPVALLTTSACASGHSSSESAAGPTSSSSAAQPVAWVEAAAPPGSAAGAPADRPRGASAAPSEPRALAPAAPQGGALEPAPGGVDFTPEARVLFRVAACGDGDLPDGFDPAVVARHCDQLRRDYDEYRRAWVDPAEPFIANLRPKNLPPVVVYPFGGGDLVSELATYPDALDVTTISLEPAGDVRPVDHLPKQLLAHELGVHRSHLERLFEKAHSRTDNLDKESKAELPGELVFDLAALAVHGDEPVSLRYFRLRPDGSIVYVTQEDVDAARTPAARRALFADAELRFRKAGAPDAPVRVLRHVSYNLDDAHLKADPSLLAFLEAKGKVATMTKAATHLLWDRNFSTMRAYIAGHTDWMISDSTGLPPRYAAADGFVQDTYGVFDGPAPFGAPDKRDGDDLRRLFASEPKRDLTFRYGYPDRDGHAHMIVTHRPAVAGP